MHSAMVPAFVSSLALASARKRKDDLTSLTSLVQGSRLPCEGHSRSQSWPSFDLQQGSLPMSCCRYGACVQDRLCKGLIREAGSAENLLI